MRCVYSIDAYDHYNDVINLAITIVFVRVFCTFAVYFRAVKLANGDERQLYPLRPMNRVPRKYQPQSVDYDRGTTNHIQSVLLIAVYQINIYSYES